MVIERRDDRETTRLLLFELRSLEAEARATSWPSCAPDAVYDDLSSALSRTIRRRDALRVIVADRLLQEALDDVDGAGG